MLPSPKLREIFMAYFRSYETDLAVKNDGIFLSAGIIPIMKLYEGLNLSDIVDK
jgi:hypothetical protein